ELGIRCASDGRVDDPDGRQRMPTHEFVEGPPGHSTTIVAAPKPPPPESTHFGTKGAQGPCVTRDTVVRIVSMDLSNECHVLVIDPKWKLRRNQTRRVLSARVSREGAVFRFTTHPPFHDFPQ